MNTVSAEASYNRPWDACAFQCRDNTETHPDFAVQRTHLLRQTCQLNNRIKVLRKRSWRGASHYRNSQPTEELVFSPQRSWKIMRGMPLESLLASGEGWSRKMWRRESSEKTHLTATQPFSFSPSVTASILPGLLTAVNKGADTRGSDCHHNRCDLHLITCWWVERKKWACYMVLFGCD